MTIQMRAAWNGMEEDSIQNLGATEENRLIAAGLARDYTPGMDGRNPVFSNAEQAAVQALVSRAGIAAAVRIAGSSATFAGSPTFHLTMRAPAHFDGVRVVLHNAVSGANTYSVSCAAPASVGGSPGRNPLTTAGTALDLTPLTFGGSDSLDFRSIGGATTAAVSNASGSGATLREGYAVSDYLGISSLDRTDIPGAPPLFVLRIFGTNQSGISAAESSSASGNPWSAAEPDFVSGYFASDQTAVSAPGGGFNQAWAPAVSVIFYLRGVACRSIGVAGDSLEQGWANTTAVNFTPGQIDGWPRKLVRLLSAAGRTSSLQMLGAAGEKSFVFHQRAMNALEHGGLTHLFVKPWSVNESGDGAASVPPALRRTQQIIDTAIRRGVVPIIIRPWAGQQTTGVGAPVQSFCDSAAGSGIAVMDARLIVSASLGSDVIRPEFLSLNAGGTAVDSTHINNAGHAAIADYAFRTATAYRL